jgi:hypothetical protein
VTACPRPAVAELGHGTPADSVTHPAKGAGANREKVLLGLE